MKPEELPAIRERVEKATQGPWLIRVGHFVFADAITSSGNEIVIGTENTPGEDMLFIAHAREDVPKLLDEIERLRVGLKQIVKLIETCGDGSVFLDYIDEIARQALEGEQ